MEERFNQNGGGRESYLRWSHIIRIRSVSSNATKLQFTGSHIQLFINQQMTNKNYSVVIVILFYGQLIGHLFMDSH